MKVWRICISSSSDKLTGMGGLYVSGRWHHVGHRILYTSASPSLAALEVLVHVDPSLAPIDLVLLEIEIPDGVSTESCDPSLLIPNWQEYPAPLESQDFGTQWLTECRSALLLVPSAIMPIESNILINPEHKEAAKITVKEERPFIYDPRLFKH